LVFEADMRLKEIGLERIRWQAVSATIFLCIPASWLQEISNFVLRKCCNVTFLPGDRASEPFWKESSLQARFFITDHLFQDSLC
jgi:hypothetical protein